MSVSESAQKIWNSNFKCSLFIVSNPILKIYISQETTLRTVRYKRIHESGIDGTKTDRNWRIRRSLYENGPLTYSKIGLLKFSKIIRFNSVLLYPFRCRLTGLHRFSSVKTPLQPLSFFFRYYRSVFCLKKIKQFYLLIKLNINKIYIYKKKCTFWLSLHNSRTAA